MYVLCVAYIEINDHTTISVNRPIIFMFSY